MLLAKAAPAVVCLLTSALAMGACAQGMASGQAREGGADSVWVDLRTDDSTAQQLRALWADRLPSSQARWAAGPGNRAAKLPAFSLAKSFDTARGAVTVSYLFSAVDCEMPGNGAGADLWARCPLRIAAANSAKVQQVGAACMLYVPPADPGAGPDPARNRTVISLDVNRKLSVRVIQFGRPVPACDLDLQVP